jgi:hypothetical protein
MTAGSNEDVPMDLPDAVSFSSRLQRKVTELEAWSIHLFVIVGVYQKQRHSSCLYVAASVMRLLELR